MRELPDSPGPTEVLGRAESEESHTLALKSGLGVWRSRFNSWPQAVRDLGQLFNLSEPQFPSQ